MSITKKIVAIVTGLTLVVMMAPGLAQGATVEELQAQINALLAQLSQLQSQLSALQGAGVTGCTITSFDRNLKQGMTGDDVKCLQIVLNSDAATQVAASGAGSPGNETSYFGSLTKAAVIKFQEKYAADVLTPIGLTAGTGFVGAKTIAKLNSLLAVVTPPAGVVCGNAVCETGETTANCPADCPAVAAGLTVALAADTPAAGTIATTSGTSDLGSSATELVKITFTNGDSTDVKVTSLKLNRIGISDDTTLPAIYLFDGYTRLGDESTLSSGVVTFNNSAGIFTVPAGGSKTISVRADIKTATSGQTVGMKLAAAADITTDASAVNGTFPITGNLMSTAQASTPATAYLTLSTPNPTGTTVSAANDVIIWENTLNVSQQNANLEYLRLTQIGSISAGDLDNIRLYVGGVQVATTTSVAGTVGQDLIFDLSAAPIAITKGQAKTITVYADIVGGATKTIRIGLEKSSDIFLKDTAYSNYVMVGIGSATTAFTPNRTSSRTIDQGTVTVTRRSDSPSAAVVLNASNVSLAKFDVKANGEEIKINSLRVQAYVNDTDVVYLRNGSLLLDGVQVGNTQVINTDKASTTYQTFNIYQKISAGVTKTLEVKADVYGCSTTACATNTLDTANTILIKIIGGDIDNAQGMSSLAMIDAPAATAEATTLDIGTGALTLKANPAYSNQSTAPGSDTKIGSFVLTSAEYDAINISAFTVAVNVTTMALTDLSNIYLKYDGSTTAAKGTVSSSNVFSVSTTLGTSKSMTIDVWSTIASTVTSGSVYTTLAITATRATDGNDASKTAVTGQTITVAAANLSTKKASDSPDTAIVVGQSTDVLMGKFTLSALYEAFTVTRAKITVDTGTDDDFVSLYLKYKNAAGTTVTSSSLPLSDRVADFTGMTMYVPNGGNANLEVYANLNAVAVAGYANSGDLPRVALTYYKASSGSNPSWIGDVTSAGTKDEDLGAKGKQANQMLLYKTQPTVAISGTTTGTLTNAPTLYKFTIGADSKGEVEVKKITFNVSTAIASATATLNTFKFYRGTTDLTEKVAIENASGSLEGTTNTIDNSEANMEVTVTFDAGHEEGIAADTSYTYYLKATLTGTVATGDNVSTYIKDDSDATGSTPAAYATVDGLATGLNNFIWSDNTYPASLHSTSSLDWTNGYLVNTLDTDTYTLYK